LHNYCHAVPGKWNKMGVIHSPGGYLRWFRDALCQEEVARARQQGVEVYELLTAAAAAVPPGAEGLLFLPYLAGERTPYPDPNARGVFIGLSLRHSKAHLVRAVLEGVTFGMRDSLEIMREQHIEAQQIRASGGGGRSALWRQIQADVFGAPVTSINVEEGPAFGVALLAGVGTGLYASVPEACQATIRVVSETKPRAEVTALYERYYRLYRSLYPLLRGTFTQVAALVNS
ncbi:MAG: xylulokinase, partial [Calditrichaeota bacterium]|nr:xylulokinase [Calditrichota bacterium]